MSQFLSKIVRPKWGNISRIQALLIDPDFSESLSEIRREKMANPEKSVSLQIKKLLLNKNDFGPRD